jgi:hypothetical protein
VAPRIAIRHEIARNRERAKDAELRVILVRWHPLSRIASTTGCLLVLHAAACARFKGEASRDTPEHSPSSLASVPAVTSKVEVPREPLTLLELPASAYAATLAADGEAVYVLTSTAAHRVVPGQEPQRWEFELGHCPVLTGDHVVYWSEGAIRRVPKRGGESVVVASVPHAPQRLAAGRDRFAWLDHAESGSFTIQTLAGEKPRVVIAAQGAVAALAVHEERAYFVEETSGGFRLGAVSLGGGAPRYSPEHLSRTPAMLAVAEGVFYYDGPSSTVRRTTDDLQREHVVGRDVICSPIAVSNSIYCAQPGGIIELALDGGSPRVLVPSARGSITAFASLPAALVWLADGGENRLVLRSLPLTK